MKCLPLPSDIFVSLFIFNDDMAFLLSLFGALSSMLLNTKFSDKSTQSKKLQGRFPFLPAHKGNGETEFLWGSF